MILKPGVVGLGPVLSETAKPCTGTPCPWGGMKCIFSGNRSGNDVRLAMNSDVPCSVDSLQMAPIYSDACV